MKMSRSITTVQALAKRGAVVLVATHLGRPKGRDPKLSTRRLARIAAIRYGVDLTFIPDALDTPNGSKAAQSRIADAKPGAIFLLENVRYYKGEEKNEVKLAKAYASLADLFMNDAFASCHRSHASVVGIAKQLPRYAGPTLVEEVVALTKLITKPKHPFVAIIGGAKLTTKFPVLSTLLKAADTVCVGGAMANAFFKSQRKEIGKSFVEKEGVVIARKLLKNKKLQLPVDVVVASKIAVGARAHAVPVGKVKKSEAIGDIGPETMRAWSQTIKQAKTIVWNGPLGVTEIPSFRHGSMVVARVIAERSKGKAYGVVGGGDTLPVVLDSGMSEWIDHLSTGGGAMLEFIAKNGRLPGLLALAPVRKKRR